MPQPKNIVGNLNISIETNLHVDDHTADLALNLFCLNAKEKGVPGFLIEIGKDGMPHVSALETRVEVEYLHGEHVAWGPVRKDSKIEVWSGTYINKHYNNEEDKNSKIVQIENGYNGDWNEHIPIFQPNCDLYECEKYFKGEDGWPVDTDRKVTVGQKYRHFKGKIVEVLAISQDTEMPGQFVVVYIDKDNQVWHRPLGMFLSEVDHEKYPLVKQKYRFELLRRLNGIIRDDD